MDFVVKNWTTKVKNGSRPFSYPLPFKVSHICFGWLVKYARWEPQTFAYLHAQTLWSWQLGCCRHWTHNTVWSDCIESELTDILLKTEHPGNVWCKKCQDGMTRKNKSKLSPGAKVWLFQLLVSVELGSAHEAPVSGFQVRLQTQLDPQRSNSQCSDTAVLVPHSLGVVIGVRGRRCAFGAFDGAAPPSLTVFLPMGGVT